MQTCSLIPSLPFINKSLATGPENWTISAIQLIWKSYLLHGLTCSVPCVRELHYFIVKTIFISEVECLMACNPIPSKPLTFRSLLIHSTHVFLGWPLGLPPVTIVLSTFLGHVSGSIHWRWPYQQRFPCLSTFSMLHRPNRLLRSSDDILYASFVEKIHLIIISLRLRWETSFCVAAHVSLTYNETLCTHAL